jgi:hypothetical protein
MLGALTAQIASVRNQQPQLRSEPDALLAGQRHTVLVGMGAGKAARTRLDQIMLKARMAIRAKLGH